MGPPNTKTSVAASAARLLFVCAGLLICECQLGSKEIFATEGEGIVLECTFNVKYSSNGWKFYWLKKGDNADSIAFGSESVNKLYTAELNAAEGSYKLYIKNTTYVNDNRQFVCRARDDDGSYVQDQEFNVVVLIPPERPEISTQNNIATEGKPYQLSCSSIGGSPDPDIQWYRDGDSNPLGGTLQPGGGRDKATVNVYTLDPKKEDDGARLKCRVSSKALENSGQPSYETFLELKVHYIPRVSIHPRSMLSVEKGTSATASCKVDAKPEPISIKWTHNGRAISVGSNLNVKPTNSDDAGSYACVADNGLGTTGQAELKVDMLYGPNIQLESKKDAREGDDVSVRCSVSANPPAEIQWFKEGDPTFTSSGEILRLQRISALNMGRYICQATNVLHPSFASSPIKKTANATVAIWIRHRPGIATILPENAVGVEGRPLTLTCQISPPGWPEPSFKWWKDTPSNTLPYGINYTVSQVKSDHAGKYHCEATNDLGKSNIATLDLLVYEPPKFLKSLTSELSKKTMDKDLSVTCEVQSKPRPLVRWLKNGQQINSTIGQFDISTNEQAKTNGVYVVSTTLRFFGMNRPNNNQLTVDDRGVYTCEFDNEVVEAATSNMSLKIEHGPILRHTKKKVAFDPGSSAILECRMQAYPAPTFMWSFANTIISSGMSQYKMNRTDLGDDVYLSVLHLSNLRTADYGEYTCSANNQLDTAKTHIKLVQRGVAEAPTNLIPVNITHNSIGLQWTKGFDGGYPDTAFVVTYWSVGIPGQYIECGTSDFCNIAGLREMTDYHFRVKARNEQGESDESDEITIQTKIDSTNIPPPTSVYYNKDSLELTFTAPNSPLTLVGKLEILIEGEWNMYNAFIPIENQEARIYFERKPWETIQNLQVSLCLQNDTSFCGRPVAAVEGAPPSLMKASTAGLATQFVIVIAVCSVLGILFIVGIIATCYYCKSRDSKEKKMNKNFEMEQPGVDRPKAITKPYYPEGIINKGVDNNADVEDVKVPQYVDQMPSLNNQGMMDHQGMPHHLPNGHMLPGYPYLDRDYNNSNGGSVDSQDSLWLKANGEMVNDRSYGYEPSLSNAYLYPDDYHHIHEDLMNQRNRENIYNSNPYAPLPKPKSNNDPMELYRDVSNLPDPYMEQEEKPPHLSFDESLESGYSTPNSRTRRVIREIIV